MSLIVEALRVYDYFSGISDPTDFLAEEQSQEFTVEIDVRFELYRLAQDTGFPVDDPNGQPNIILAPISAVTGRLQDFKTIWISDLALGWQDYKVGDEITVVDATTGANDGTATITEILDQQTLKTDKTFTSEELPVDAYVAVTTKQTAMEFRHGLLENQEQDNYTSKVDGSEQIAKISDLDNTVTTYGTADLFGANSWQFGSIQVKGNNQGLGINSTVSQGFTIKHESIINPVMLFDQWDDIVGNIAPSYLLNGASLRYAFKVESSPEVNNPNDNTRVVSGNLLGNVGWFNENLSGGSTNYSITDLKYQRLDNTLNDALELTTNETKVKFCILNTTDTPFSDGNTKITLGFNFAPSTEDEYRGVFAARKETLDYNFVIDNVEEVLGSGGTAIPKQIGTDKQVIKSLSTTFVSGGQINCEARVEMDSELVARLTAKTTKRYMLYVQVANHTLSRASTDKVQLKLDADDFYVDTSDDTLVSISNKFIEHPDSDIDTESKTVIEARIEDDVLAISDITLDKNTRETDEIIFTKATMQIIAKKSDTQSFILDGFNTDLTILDVIDDATYGDVPFVDFTQQRGFATPADNNRGRIKLLRRADLDAAGVFAYQFQFPFILRWEDWQKNRRADDEFFDVNEGEDGKNEEWTRYDSFTGWDIFYRVELKLTKNGNEIIFEKETQILTADHLAGVEWDTEELFGFDSNGDEITVSGTSGLNLFENSTIQANKTFIGAVTPTLPDLVAVMKINVFGKGGGFKEQHTLSSAYGPRPRTWWKGISPATGVTITNPGGGNIFRAEALLQGLKLPDQDTFRISCRFYDLRAEVPFGDSKIQSGGGGDFKKTSNSIEFKLLS